MALTKTPQAVQAVATNAAGGTTTSAAFDVNYGVSGVAVVTNGGTGPAAGCDFVIEVSNDGGTSWFEWSRQTATTTASAVSRFPFQVPMDWGRYRVKFTSNTGQAVTCQADAGSTSAL